LDAAAAKHEMEPYAMADNIRNLQLGRSVFLRQKECGHGSISFGDNPYLFRIRDWIAAHQPEAMFEAQFVFGLVFLAPISPVTAMSRQEFERGPLTLLKESECAWSRGDLTRREKSNDG
jgi:hypothetical protein